jgi:hypothetical protein
MSGLATQSGFFYNFPFFRNPSPTECVCFLPVLFTEAAGPPKTVHQQQGAYKD